MTNLKNQTLRDHLTNQTLNERGTGIFAVPDPERGVRGRRIVRLPNLSYKETIQRGAECIAYRWVPTSVMSFQDIQTEALRGCVEETCWEDTDCPGASCFCDFESNLCYGEGT